MKILHICDKQTFLKHALNFKSCHYLELLNGKVITIGEIGETFKQNFEREPTVEKLPYMLAGESIGTAASALGHLGINPQHKAHEVMAILSKIHPAFEISQF